MRVIYVLIAFVFGSQLIFAQSVCGVKEIKEAMEKATTENQENDRSNDAKYRKALSQLSKVKKWTPTQESSYELKLISIPSVVECEKKKMKFIEEMMEVLMKADEKVTDANNCEVLDLTLKKLELGWNENKKEWQIMMLTVATDYKLVTQKDLVIE
jgi:hypothetical protein